MGFHELHQSGDSPRPDLLDELGQLVDVSQKYTDEYLCNLIHETRWLPMKARELGALAASAFGAGFGGSVWAVVKADKADDFLAAWKRSYAEDEKCSKAANTPQCNFFKMVPGPGAFSLSGKRWGVASAAVDP